MFRNPNRVWGFFLVLVATVPASALLWADGTHHLAISHEPSTIVAKESFDLIVEAHKEDGSVNTSDSDRYNIELSDRKEPTAINLGNGEGRLSIVIEKAGLVLATITHSQNAQLRAYEDLDVKKKKVDQ